MTPAYVGRYQPRRWAWEKVEATRRMQASLPRPLDAAFVQLALSRFPAVGLDGYDLFTVEATLQCQIITDDGD